jgi:energy-coupling factor transporter ATP-binding protein EcfA2
MSIEFGFDSRTILAGGTGSGKTTLAKKLINTYYNASKGKIPIYIIDSKMFGDFKEYEKFGHVVQSEEAPDPFIPDEKLGSFQIWQTYQTDENDDGAFGEYLQKIFDNREPCLIFIDELSSMCSQSGKKYPKALDLIYKQGRALNMAVICCTQAVSNFPKITLTQSSHAIRMNLNDEYDVKKLARIMGKQVEEAPLHQFGFWYRNLMKPVRTNPPEYFKDHKEFF